MSTSRGILAFGRFPKHRIEFNKVLSCSAVAPIQQKSLLVMLHRKTQLAQPTMSIADIVLDIGVAWVAQCGKLERRDGPTPIPSLPRWYRSAISQWKFRFRLWVRYSEPRFKRAPPREFNGNG